MEPTSYSDKVLEAYLTHELADDEIPALEDQLLRDEELFQQLETVEMNLIDRYLENEMTDTEKQHFEAGFLSDEDNKRKLNEARVFRESLGSLRQKEPPGNVTPFPVAVKRLFESVRVQQIAAAAIVLIVLALIVLLAVIRWRESQLPDKNISSMSTKVVPPEPPSPSPTQRKTKDRIREQWLSLKERNDLPVTIPPDTDVLRLLFELLDDTSTRDSFRVSIKNEPGNVISPGAIDVKPISTRYRGVKRRAVSIDVPVTSLKIGERYRFEIADPYQSKTFVIERAK